MTEGEKMYKASVAYISFYENTIILEIVEVENKDWREALHKHSAFNQYPIEDLDWLPIDYEEAREESINGEIEFSVLFHDEPSLSKNEFELMFR